MDELSMNQTARYPGIGQAIVLMLLVLLLMIGLSIPTGLVSVFLNIPLVEHPAVLAAINLIAFSLMLIRGHRKTRLPLSEVFPLGPIPACLYLPMALTILGMCILLSELGNLILLVLPMPRFLAELFMGLASGKISGWGSILALVVVAPLTEELFFRGLILRGFLSRYTVRKAIVVSAVLFGALHLNPWQFPGAAVLGVVFAWWFLETGSLLPCLFGHALNNAVPVVLLGIFSVEVRGLTSSPSSAQFQPLWLDLSGVLVAGLGIWLLVRAFGNHRATECAPRDMGE